jgi:hypothetical protein
VGIMEYGILIVEDGNELYQVLGAVWDLEEARELAENYESCAGPDVDYASVPPELFVIVRRGPEGFYSVREPFTL